MTIHSIQYLRGVAATMVVIFHLYIQLQRMNYHGSFPHWLSSGVDIFFVISGFIMWSTTVDRNVSALEFVARRFIRIVPLYWLITTFFVIMMLVAPNALQSSQFDLPHIVSSYFFFPHEHPVTHVMEPVVVPGWTLNYEMFFYLIFAVWLLFRRSIRIIGILLTLGLFVSFGFLTKNEVIDFYASSIILEFGFGVIIAHLVHEKIFLPRWVMPVAVVVFVATVWTTSYVSMPAVRFLFWGAPAAFLVFSAISYERREASEPLRPLELVGNASYSIYLIHGVVLSAVSQLWRRFFPYGDLVSLSVFCLAATAAAVAAGIGLYWLFERPVEASGKSLLRRAFPRRLALRSTGAY